MPFWTARTVSRTASATASGTRSRARLEQLSQKGPQSEAAAPPRAWAPVKPSRIGQLYNYAVDHQLAERLGYKKPQEYFSQHIKALSRQTLENYGAVARVFSAETCGQYGVNALRVLLTYAEAAGEELNRNDPSTTLIAVPDEDGVVEEKFFGECTVEELRKALQRLRRPTSSAPLPAEAQARAEQCHAVWTGYFPKNAGVRVELRNLGAEGTPV